MAQTRKDLRGRVLRKGESQRRSDGRYVYTYTDPLGRRKYVYAQDLSLIHIFLIHMDMLLFHCRGDWLSVILMRMKHRQKVIFHRRSMMVGAM